MNILAEIQPIIPAAVGGLTVNVLNLLELQHIPKDRRPDFRDPLYWLPFAVWPLLGGFVGYLYNEASSPLGKLVAFHIGVSSPLILRTMTNVIPPQAAQSLPPGA